MKITLEHADLTEPEIIIRGQTESAQVRNLIELLGGKQQKMFFLKNEYEYIFDISDVSYFETDGSKVMAHIENDIYETRLKLYEIESIGKPRVYTNKQKRRGEYKLRFINRGGVQRQLYSDNEKHRRVSYALAEVCRRF